MRYDLLIVGVGGQGIILVSDIISDSALREGLYVKKSETHGMAQRGGSVVTHVRISDEKVASPLIPKGAADMLLSFEALEALRYLDYLGEKTKIIVNRGQVKIPNYPEEEKILSELSKRKALVVDAQKLAVEAGHPLTQNIVMLGAASSFLPVKKEALEESIKMKVKRALEENMKAFKLGADQSL